MSLEKTVSLWDAETKVSFLSVFLSFLLFCVCCFVLFYSLFSFSLSLFFLSLHCTFSKCLQSHHFYFFTAVKDACDCPDEKKKNCKILGHGCSRMIYARVLPGGSFKVSCSEKWLLFLLQWLFEYIPV